MFAFYHDNDTYDFKIDHGNRFLSTFRGDVFSPIFQKKSGSRDISYFVLPLGGNFFKSPHITPSSCARRNTRPHALQRRSAPAAVMPLTKKKGKGRPPKRARTNGMFTRAEPVVAAPDPDDAELMAESASPMEVDF